MDLRKADGVAVTSVLAQPRRAALLTYLAIARPRGFHRRDTLIALFWEERDEDAARKALRQALYFLRSSLGEGAVIARGDAEVAVDPDTVATDVVDFDAAIAAGDLEKALELYAGELMPGLNLDEAPEFERWLAGERARLRAAAAAAAWKLAERAARVDAVAAMAFASTALDVSLLDHAGLTRVCDVLVDRGETAAVAQLADDFASRWRLTYGDDPPEALKERFDAYRAQRPVDRGGNSFEPSSAAFEATNESASTEPAQRFVREAATNPVRAPAFGSAEEPVQDATPGRRRGLLPVVVASGIAVILGYVGIAGTLRGPEVDPRLVQIAPFATAVEDQPVGRMIADWLIQSLATTDLSVVPLGLGQWAGDSVSIMNDRRPGLFITGTVGRTGGVFQVRASVTDARGRGIGHIEPVTGTDAMEVAERVRQRVLPVIAAHYQDNLTKWANAARPPTSIEAYQAFATGMDEFVEIDYAAAIPAFRRAIAADSLWILPRIWLVFALGNAGAPIAEVQNEVRELHEMRRSMTPFEAALSDYHWANWAMDSSANPNESALRATRRLVEIVPASEWHFLHARTALFNLRPREALEAFSRAEPDRGWLRNWGVYWMYFAVAAHYAGDFERAIQIAREGRRRFPDAYGILEEVGASLAAMGRVAELDSLGAVAASLASPTRSGGIGARIYWGHELEAHGFPAEARRVYADAIRAYEQMGATERAIPLYRHHYAIALIDAERYDEADVVLRGLLAEDPGDIDLRHRAAIVDLRRGDRTPALSLAAELERAEFGNRHYLQAELFAELGMYGDAVTALREAMRDPRYPAYAFFLHEYDWARGAAEAYSPFAALIRPRD